MSKFLIVTASLFCIVGATIAYAGSCEITRCRTSDSGITTCICF